MLSLLKGPGRPASSPLGGCSYWQRHAGPRLAAPVPGPLPSRVDFAVVGGGLAGLSTALALAEAEPSAAIAVLEAHFVGYGASGRNAGLLGPLPAPLWLASAGSNAEHLWGLAHLNRRVLDIGRSLVADAPETGVAPTTLHIEAQGRLTATGLARVARLIGRAGIEHRTATGPGGHLAVELDSHAVDPYRTVLALAAAARARGVAIHEGAPVRGLEETPAAVTVALADGRTIEAARAIVCTNAYTASLTLPAASVPKAKVVYNFMVATTPIDDVARIGHPDPRHFVVELNTAYVFYRLHRGRIVYGGIERFKPWSEDDFAVPPDVLAGLERLIARSFPGVPIEPAEAWGGRYHQTPTDLPVLARTGSRGAIVLNVGYGGTGVAMTMICGRLAAALARDERFADADDARLYRALAGTRMPIADLVRFVAGVAGDVVLFRRPR